MTGSHNLSSCILAIEDIRSKWNVTTSTSVSRLVLTSWGGTRLVATTVATWNHDSAMVSLGSQKVADFGAWSIIDSWTTFLHLSKRCKSWKSMESPDDVNACKMFWMKTPAGTPSLEIKSS
jgi:hypothetical protein